ncbi:MAG: hypothetical protein RBT66_07990 [bacterium]|jgi:surface antigen|nr:hypothetical protein [bacterium]
MLTEKVNKLLEKVTEEEALKIKVLHNARIKALKACQADSTSAKYKDWQTMEAALVEEVSRLENKYAPTGEDISWRSFQDTGNKSKVLRFLKAMGYQVADRSFFRHCSSGRLKTGVNGLYTARTVKAYAASLPRTGTAGLPEEEHESNLQNEKLRIDIQRGEISRQMEEIKLARLQGSVVDREALSLELAARAVALDSGYKQLVASEAMEWIVLVGGDTDKLPEFIDELHQAWDELIGKYASQAEFEVLFEDQET